MRVGVRNVMGAEVIVGVDADVWVAMSACVGAGMQLEASIC